MRSASEIPLYRTFAVLMLTVLLVVGSTMGVQASLITNGDFSTGDLTGWRASEGADVVSFATIPPSYSSNWDLSPWNNTMNGNFALIQVASAERPNLVGGITTGPSNPIMASFNYAVAWEVVNPDNQPYFGESQSYYEGYLRIEVEGKATTGDNYFLGYNDVSWSTPQNGPTKGVVTGSASTGFIDYSNRYYFTEYEVSFLVFNPYLVMSEIIGFDDVALITEPAPVGPAPVPEPASAIMLMFAGLAGMASLRSIKST
ncbi:PEP-CTERM sorting domain-containing protein [Pelotalea chapellei]|uniref:PEP-CTERM sorting domain-containing protein n=1 Tax=Pelotalea chapellei TaxID=44671 RepID=A0ABS5UBR5_9BACT|nr:PEP-CTERM sorting domain-containing protein [Pelotalea chapellei]MBT1073086.1 PEP-CTERM sorting domain-containing protein [Pelotalea chapellei]